MPNDVYTGEKSTLSAKFNYWWYWNVRRRSGVIGRKIIWKLPKRVIYWCVIRAAVEVEPNSSPAGVTAEEMLKKFNYN
jgi:hypothetical protein